MPQVTRPAKGLFSPRTVDKVEIARRASDGVAGGSRARAAAFLTALAARVKPQSVRSTPRAEKSRSPRPLCRGVAAALALVLCLGSTPAQAREADFRRFTDYLWLLLGAGAGFVTHESGHLILDGVLGTEPTFVPTYLGPFPFFAIQPSHIRNNQQRYAIAQAGFMMEGIYSELILGLDPHLREHHHPFLKGMLGFHIVLDIGYAVTGLANVGPAQSDVNTMARGLGVPPWAIGLMLIVPALTDTYRYFVPDSRWAPWVSLGGKLTMLGATLAF